MRLARWMMVIQSLDVSVIYAPGDGTLMAVPDALLRDTMDPHVTLCQRCLESANAEHEVEEATSPDVVLDVASVRRAQRNDLGVEKLAAE
jgi:hypothetical protein